MLLEKGYFPSELPPPFVTLQLAKYRNSIFHEWETCCHSNNSNLPKTMFENFSVPRVGVRRRKLAITNPISEFYLSKCIADNWVEIKKFICTSNISLDTPHIYENQTRAIPKPDFNLITFRRLETESKYSHILESDISRFYGTIYTHAFPWALHGKEICKANVNNSSYMKALLGDKLDRLTRKGQDNQTIGIPIGPDSSRILSEIIAVGIEKKFLELSGYLEQRIFRYVDDWFIGFDTAGEAEDCVSLLSKSCSEYELELNDEKTKVVDPYNPTDDIWPSELKNIQIRKTTKGQRQDIVHYFACAFWYANKYKEKNVLDYALKVMRSKDIDHKNVRLFEANILKAARINPSSFQTAVELLINLNHRKHTLSKNDISKLINDTITRCSLVNKHGELAWALFLAKGLRITIPNEIIKKVQNVDSSICALLVLDLRKMGLLKGKLDTTYWESFMNTEALTGKMWLLAYEADFKGWLSSPNNHVDKHPYFRILKRKNIYFYDEKRNVPTTQNSLKYLETETSRRNDLLHQLGIFDYFNQ